VVVNSSREGCGGCSWVVSVCMKGLIWSEKGIFYCRGNKNVG